MNISSVTKGILTICLLWNVPQIFADTTGTSNSGDQQAAAQATGTASTPQAGSTPAPSSGTASTPQTGSTPAPSSGTASTPQTGSTPAPSSGTASTPQAGSTPAPSSGTASTPQTGSTPAPSSGTASTPQAGNTSAQPASSATQQPSNAPSNQGSASEKKSTSEQSDNCSSSDSSLTNAIKANIATNDAVSSSNIAVLVENGEVKLIGNVNSAKEANTLIEIAAAATGSKDVDITKLRINGNQKFPEDAATTAKIKGALIREKLFDDKDVIKPIEAKTTNGVVTLTGAVASQSEVDKAVKLIQSIKGVDKVKSEIVIEENKK